MALELLYCVWIHLSIKHWYFVITTYCLTAMWNGQNNKCYYFIYMYLLAFPCAISTAYMFMRLTWCPENQFYVHHMMIVVLTCLALGYKKNLMLGNLMLFDMHGRTNVYNMTSINLIGGYLPGHLPCNVMYMTSCFAYY